MAQLSDRVQSLLSGRKLRYLCCFRCKLTKSFRCLGHFLWYPDPGHRCSLPSFRGLGRNSRSSSSRGTGSTSTGHVRGLMSETNDVLVARDAATAGTGGVMAADSFGPL